MAENSNTLIGVWNYYEEITENGFLFKNTEATIGANLLKPWCDLYEYGKAHGMDFVTLDQVTDIRQLDAVIFMDRPRAGNPMVDEIMRSGMCKYLLLYECEMIKPDNWDRTYHQQFQRVFTWSDEHVDGHRYIKTNFAIDTESPYDFETVKKSFGQRKLATLIAGAKMSRHPYELYSERIRTIRWFEATAPHDFDLYGVGWSAEDFPSYRGPVQDKLGTLSKYRFNICFENAKNIPGYITEKILDSFRAAVVPVYCGAPNIDQWIPSDCFINLSQFTTFADLYEHLATMDSTAHAGYLDRIRNYLSSRQSYPYSSKCFVNTISRIISHDIALKRGDVPQLLQEARQRGADISNLTLVQNLKTLEIELEEEHLHTIGTGSEFLPGSALKESFSCGNQDLIVYFGYGYELPVFARARALWEFFVSHYPNVRAIFVRESDKLECGEVQHNGYDLLIGTGGGRQTEAHERKGYSTTGTWSANENWHTIYRQMAVYDYLLRTNDNPFFLYHATVTSVVDFRGLFAILDLMPKTGCFAGMPGRLVTPQELAGLTFTCGTNTLVSSDIMALMRSRYDSRHVHATLPNDIWQALILHDIPRLPLPFFSFTKPRKSGGNHDEVRDITRQLLLDGHFHFRIKTTGDSAGFGAREDIDPWIMLKVMETILATHPSPSSNPILIDKLAQATVTTDGKMLSTADDTFFTGPRDFPLNDLEAAAVYQRVLAKSYG